MRSLLCSIWIIPEDGDWIPNKYGGRENIEAIEFLKKFNYFVHEHYPGCLTLLKNPALGVELQHLCNKTV